MYISDISNSFLLIYIFVNIGRSFLAHYGDSLIYALKSVYPDYDWLPWKFLHTNRGYWENPNNQKEFMLWAAKHLHINQLEDWYYSFFLCFQYYPKSFAFSYRLSRLTISFIFVIGKR